MSALADNPYSRFVSWMKVLLPIAALALLSTLFLFARSTDPAQTFPYSDEVIDDLVQGKGLTRPIYAGVTRSGARIAVSADIARPDPGAAGDLSASGMAARLVRPDGMVTDIIAEDGRIEGQGERANLTGRTVIVRSDGYRIEANGLEADLRSGAIASYGGIVATTPFGSLDAASMSYDPGDGPGDARLLFNGGVRLVYRPTN